MRPLNGSLEWWPGKPDIEYKEYLVFIYKKDKQSPEFVFALYMNGEWFPDVGDRDHILYWADIGSLLPKERQ